MRVAPILSVLLLIGAALTSEVRAQAMHLAPPVRPLIGDTAVILHLRSAVTTPKTAADSAIHSAFTREDGVVFVDGQTLYFRTNTVLHGIEMGDRNLRDFVEILRTSHGLYATTNYPGAHVSDLRRGDVSVREDGAFDILVRDRGADIAAVASIGFTLNDTHIAESSNLLKNAGLNLDLVGSRVFGGFAFRTRIGFGTAQPVPTEGGIEKDDGGSQELPGGLMQGDLGSIIKLAQALTIGLNLDLSLGSMGKQSHILLGLDASRMWAAPPPFVFPTVAGIGEPGPVEEQFSPEQIAEARRTLDRVVPLGTMVGGPRLTFGNPDDPKFYVLADLGFRQYHLREYRARYRTTPPTDSTPTVRTPDRISASVGAQWEPIARVGMGLRVSGAISLRVDYVNALRDRPVRGFVRVGEPSEIRPEPLLRVALTAPDLRFGR